MMSIAYFSIILRKRSTLAESPPAPYRSCDYAQDDILATTTSCSVTSASLRAQDDGQIVSVKDNEAGLCISFGRKSEGEDTELIHKSEMGVEGVGKSPYPVILRKRSAVAESISACVGNRSCNGVAVRSIHTCQEFLRLRAG